MIARARLGSVWIRLTAREAEQLNEALGYLEARVHVEEAIQALPLTPRFLSRLRTIVCAAIVRIQFGSAVKP